MARCASGNGSRREESRREASRWCARTAWPLFRYQIRTGERAVRGVNEVDVIQQSISDNTVAFGLPILVFQGNYEGSSGC